MEAHYKDVSFQTRPREWCGLELTVHGAANPGVVVSCTAGRRIRISLDGRAVLWTRIDDDYWGYEILRAASDVPPGVIPPITFSMVEQLGCRSSGDHARRWAKAYAEMLTGARLHPFHDGRWHLGLFEMRLDEPLLPAAVVASVVEQQSHGYIQWDFGDEVYPVTLRDMSREDSGRVKAWRKRARDGLLPPILLYWVSGLDAYLVLDGHDRLLASALEGMDAPALALEAIRETTTEPLTREATLRQVMHALDHADGERASSRDERRSQAHQGIAIERANELLLHAFVPKRYSAPTPRQGSAGRTPSLGRRGTG